MRLHPFLLGVTSLILLAGCTSDDDSDADTTASGGSTSASTASGTPSASGPTSSSGTGSASSATNSGGSSGSSDTGGGSASSASNSGGGDAGGSDPTGGGGGAVVHHGDEVTIDGDFGTEAVISTFLGGADGAIEALGEGDRIPSGEGWSFDDYVTTAKTDPVRGTVLYNTESEDVYNATRIYDAGVIPEQRSFYKAHWVRNVMTIDGAPWLKSYQWKHERVSWQYVWTDTDVELGIFNWQTLDPVTVVRRSDDNQEAYWGGVVPDHNGEWAMMELIVTTGTQGGDDGMVVTRVHKNGHTQISQNLQSTRVYDEADHRLRYFIEQNYFGNFGQNEDGVDNTAPHPDVRELWSDDSRVIVGTTPETGRRRIELRDAVELEQATLREVQSWTDWNGAITLHLNAGGLPVGRHDLFLVVIDGVDANGWDNVVASQPVTVEVP